MDRKTQSRIPPPNKRKITTSSTSNNAERKSTNQIVFEPPLQPVFASVHRPRHQTSSVKQATVKRSNLTSSASQTNAKLQMQQQNASLPYNPQNYIKDCQNENNRIFNQVFMPMPMPVQIPHPNYGPPLHGSSNATPASHQHQNSPKRAVQQQNHNNLKQNINQKLSPSFHPPIAQNQQLINVNSKIPTTSQPQFNQITRMTTNLVNNCDMQPTSSSAVAATTTSQHKFSMKIKENVYESVKHHIYEQIDHHKRSNINNSRATCETNNLNRPKNLTVGQQQVAPPVQIQNRYNMSNVPIFNPELLKYFQGQIVQNLSPIDERGNGQLGMNLMMETAQVLATAAYVERAAQRISTGNSNTGNASRSRNVEKQTNIESTGGYCGALLKNPPPMPAGLARKLVNRENSGAGKVKVMLRVSDNPPQSEEDNANSFMNIDKKKRQVMLSDTATTSAPSTERGPMVKAPKMFAFDSLFTPEDSQYDICGSALSEAIPAVLEGSDACFLSFGYPRAGHTKTMMGSVTPNDLGAIPCAISWLFKGINEKRQKTGARFSVRVSALGVNATKPGTSAKDLLAGYATDAADESPGMYLKDDLLGGVSELRAPTADKAASFFDAALLGRNQTHFEPALIFTLHVYQYTVSGKGGVAGGRSRLHLIDLGGCANRSGGIPLSGFGNVLLAILSGQRHPPNRDHPLTPLLKDCLAPLTCHVAIVAHVSHSQTHTDTLTTIQVATRIHRMRRRKHRNPMQEKSGLNSSHQNGSSSGPDPSSSDLSQDTVIYMGPSTDDATDGEHPPVYHPSFSAEDKSSLSKALKKCEESPVKKPLLPERNVSIKFNESMPVKRVVPNLYTSPKIVAGALKYCDKGSSIPAPKPSPLKRPVTIGNASRLVNEQWIDGPNAPVVEHRKSIETWIDGPKSEKPGQFQPPKAASLTQGYGFMDGHKKFMIRQWVENQSTQISHLVVSAQPQPVVRMNPNFRDSVIGEETNEDGCSSKSEPINNKPSHRIKSNDSQSEISSSRQSSTEEDQDSGPSEVPPALPLMNPLASREVSMESLHKLALQAVERGIFTNDEQCSQINERDHPLSALSQGDFSVVSSFHNGVNNMEENSASLNARYQLDQLARLREIFTSQLALAEVIPNPFNIPDDVGSVYSEPAYRFNADRNSLCSESVIRPKTPKCHDYNEPRNFKRSASETSLPSLNGIVTIAGMEQFASLRHPDGASDPDLPTAADENDKLMEHGDNDSGLDTTPQTSKLSGISRRAESGYHSVGTGRDSSDICSIKSLNYVDYDKQRRKEKSLCQWLRSCTHPDEDSERETTDL